MANFFKMPAADGSSVYINPEHVSHTVPIDDGQTTVHFVSGEQTVVKLHVDDAVGRLQKK